MLELKKLSWLFFRISLCMNYSHNIYTLPSISGELRTFTINRWQYKDLSRVSVSKRAVCSYKKKMNTLYGVCLILEWAHFPLNFKQLPRYDLSKLERFDEFLAFYIGKSQKFGHQNSLSFRFLSHLLHGSTTTWSIPS